MKVYLVGEYSDYGLFDLSDAKVFKNYNDAKAYAEGANPYYHLDIVEFELN